MNQRKLPAVVVLALDVQVHNLVLQQRLQGLACGQATVLTNLRGIDTQNTNRSLLRLPLQTHIDRVAIGHKSDDAANRPGIPQGLCAPSKGQQPGQSPDPG